MRCDPYASGLTHTPDDILQVGARIDNLAGVFNTREGLTRADDTLPERLLTEPLKAGASKGHFISKEDQSQMPDECYAARARYSIFRLIPGRDPGHISIKC